MKLVPALAAVALGIGSLLNPMAAGATALQASRTAWVAEEPQALPAPPAPEEREEEPRVACGRGGQNDDGT